MSDMTIALAPRPYVAVVPRRFVPSHATYLRRRLVVCTVLALLMLVLLVGAGQVLANRGGAPASTSAVRPATAAAAIYVVQPGDTLWSIAEEFHGEHGLSSYVDTLVAINHGTELTVGQRLALP